MHNLALALHNKAYEISGSDDEIFEPSRSRLKKAGLLPPKYGWYDEKITAEIDAVILGMHAKLDNPELIKAKELGLKIYSYPEFLFEQSRDKQRVVIAGSHGKTTITAMIMHVLQEAGMAFDFMVGAQLEGFDVMVSMSKGADIMLFEGDEYLTSALDPRPKFHLYRPHIALISGIAWDHINVFPTFEMYKEQFRKFIELIRSDGTLIYYEGDKNLKDLVNSNENIFYIPYLIPDLIKEDNTIILMVDDQKFPLMVFGDHNMQNIAGAMEVCRALGIRDEVFAKAISTFKGASKRLQLIDENETTSVYLDFAHAPSKLKATVDAVKGHFQHKKLIACMELHTYSSLSKDFLDEYRGSMDKADQAYVYFNPHTLEIKRLPEISIEQVKEAFNREDLKVYNDSSEMLSDLMQQDWDNAMLLLMSSGNFDGLEPSVIAGKILGRK